MTMVARLYLGLILASSIPYLSLADGSVTLSGNTFQVQTAGKNVFIKFFAPWCGHCQSLAPTWEDLAKHYESSDRVMIASLDCTTDERFCVDIGITGFPTLLYGDTSGGGIFLEEYNGDKTLEDLTKFVDDALLEPICNPVNLEACDGATRTQMEKYLRMDASELQELIAKEEERIQDAKTKFKEQTSSMQAVYDDASRKRQLTAAAAKRQVKLFQEVTASKKVS